MHSYTCVCDTLDFAYIRMCHQCINANLPTDLTQHNYYGTMLSRWENGHIRWLKHKRLTVKQKGIHHGNLRWFVVIDWLVCNIQQLKYEIYCGDHLLCVTENYTRACRHAKNGKRVIAVSDLTHSNKYGTMYLNDERR